MRELEERVKRKSIKPIKIVYKDEIVALDPRKVSAYAFGLTAMLVLAGYGAARGVDAAKAFVANAKERYEEFEYVADYRSNLGYKIKNDNDYRNSKMYYIVDTYGVQQDIKKYDDPKLNEIDDFEVALSSYIRAVGPESKEVKDLLFSIGRSENKNFETVDDYAKDRGFVDYKDFNDYVFNTILGTRGR